MPSGRYTVQAQESIIFGQPAEKAVVNEADRYGAKRVFVLSTRSLGQLENGPLQRVIAGLGPRHVGTFTSIQAHSPRQDVIAAAYSARKTRADLLVAVGGGSVIDASKAVLICLWLGLESTQAMEPFHSGVEAGIRLRIDPPDHPIRLITVSTTLSASEFTSMAGVTDTQTHAKQSFSHRLLVPRSVILDPAATLYTPNGLLFSTAIRSVDHAVESYCSPLANPATEALSLQGLRLLARALPKIMADPNDLRPRLEAQFGMWQSIAASAAGAGSGASHGIGYVLGATYGVAHGHTSCVMLPAVLRWNAAVNADRQADLSQAMGAPRQPAADLVANLVRNLGQPGSLRSVGIKREDFEEIAQRAMAYQPVRMNPRPINGPAEVKEILELAW
ncbi:MAG: iron-containing alcohol dehydrogenase [Deltaproteobacteria bacterium]|nr:iron-containing alcohol dehydrogenase [Deltaproteobacteria bacterium]